MTEVSIPSVSIAMATYNGSKFIEKQLVSLAQQILLPSELIVCDDGSHDDTLNIIKKFAQQAPFPIRVFKNPTRLGYRANFIKAASLCSGDLIALCDQDDIWHADKLKMIVPEFRSKVLLVHHNASIMIHDEVAGALKDRPLKYQSCPMEVDPWWTAYGLTMVFRRELLHFWHYWASSVCAHVPEEKMNVCIPESHDHWVLFIASSLGVTVYLDTPLVDYRQHDSNAEGWGGEMDLSRRIRHRLERRHLVYDHCSRSAKARSLILKRIYDENGKSEALSASLAYQELWRLYKERARLYSCKFIWARCRAFVRLLRAGAYGSSGYWTWGLKGAIKDLALGLFLGRVLKAHGWPPAGSDPTCRCTDKLALEFDPNLRPSA